MIGILFLQIINVSWLIFCLCVCNQIKIRNFISHSLYFNCFYFVKNVVHSDSCSRCPDIYHNVKRNNKNSLETYRFRLCFYRNRIHKLSRLRQLVFEESSIYYSMKCFIPYVVGVRTYATLIKLFEDCDLRSYYGIYII